MELSSETAGAKTTIYSDGGFLARPIHELARNGSKDALLRNPSLEHLKASKKYSLPKD
jgi:hypothetical protein